MKTLISFALLIILHTATIGQVYPVQVNTQITPPYSPYLNDYTLPGSQNFALHIQVNDATLNDYPCKLRLTIEGPGITLLTKPDFIPPPFYLQGGVPQTLYGGDIHAYFHPNNLHMSGLPGNEYDKSTTLREGIYRFSVEVLDYNRGTVVSNKGTTMAWIILNDPPLLIFPSNFAKLKLQDPPNILFTWTPRHMGSPNAAFTTEYIFRLIELWPDNRNPNDAFLTQSPLFETHTNRNQVLFGPSEPPLLPGRKYAWQVQAYEPGGKDLFKNKGRSEIFIFQYGEALPVPPNLRMRWAKPTTLAIQWDKIKHDDGEVRYRLQYRPRLRRENHEWYETWTRFTEKTLYNLQTNTDYEMRIRSENTLQESDYSEVQVFTTLREDTEGFVCRDNVAPPPLPANSVPVFPLSVNDTIHAGGYNVVVRDVMKVGSKYYGSGLAIVPWFNDAKVRVNFENIAVNNSFWLTSGTIKSIWNSESSFLLEEQRPVTPGTAPEAGELDITIVATDSLVTIQGTLIASVTKDESGDIIVATTDGNQQTLPGGESFAVVDEAGNGYVVDQQGNIAKTTAHEANATATRGSKKYRIALQFSGDKSSFGFDEKKFDGLSSYYQQLDDGTYIPWKALSSARPDVITGTIPSGEIDIAQLTFEAGSFPVSPIISSGKHATLSLHGRVAGMEEELLALHKPSDTIPRTIVGKVNLVTYNPIHYNLEIVTVNGASMPGGVDGRTISDHLNKVYSQAVVEWDVTVAPDLKVMLGDTFNEGETGLLSNYTDDMKKVLRAYGSLRGNTYYLFIIDEPRNRSTLGYMPRNRQAGFVFSGPHEGNAREFLKTIAHELGHGAFNLHHTFREHNLPAGITDNVMDYSNGTALYKYQWDYIHEPRSVIGLFEGGEEGEMIKSDLSIFYEKASPLLKEDEYIQLVEKIKKVYEFFQSCDDEEWESYNGQGIVPYCFWRDQEISSSSYYTHIDRPFTAGLIDGGYLEIEGIYKLPEVVRDISRFPGKVVYAYTLAYWECRTEKLVANYEDYEYVIGELAEMDREGGLWNWIREQWYEYKEEKIEIEEYFEDCRDADDLRRAVDDLYELVNNWEEIEILSREVYHKLSVYWNTLQSENNIGRYERGAIIIPAASLFLPIGTGIASKGEKIKAVLRHFKNASSENLQKIKEKIHELLPLKKIKTFSLDPSLQALYDDCIRAGYRAYEEGAQIILTTTDNIPIAKISNQRLSIKIPHENGWALQSKTARAQEMLESVKSLRKVYRIGTMNKNLTAEAQYWSPESPFDYKTIWEYAKNYGIPKENLLSGDVFFEVGRIPDYVPYITREAPGVGENIGGAIEVVVPANTVKLESFSTLKVE